MSAWPSAVWDSPALRAVDARARGEIEAAGAVRAVAAGQVIFKPGDAADDLFVVVDGRVALYAGKLAVRQARAGETFGEEATVRLTATRRLEAVAIAASKVARVPATVLRRGLARSGGSPVADRLARTAAREAARDVVEASAIGRALDAAELEILLDATETVDVARGHWLRRAGDPAPSGYIVADGALDVVRDRAATRRATRGDVLDAATLTAAGLRAVAPSKVLSIRADALAPVVARAGLVEAPAPYDAHRANVARALVVIDQSACVRCGHCVASCASAHDDGLARLSRRGETITAGAATLVIATSCHHCERAACLDECPTGAIVRDAAGDVTIREDLCTGCGACVRACPWDNVALAPATEGAHTVAVKCDGCATLAGGPACVSACPADAIERVAPSELYVDRGAPPREPRGAVRAAWPTLVASALVAAAIARTPMPKMASGLLAGSAFALAAADAVAKRAPWSRGVRATRRARSRVRVPFIAHAALGVAAVGGALAHGALRIPGDAAGALVLAFWTSMVSGAAAAIAYRFIPPRLARIERTAMLPEDLAPRAQSLEEQTFAALTGQTVGTKRIYEAILAPYARAPLGGVTMAIAARALDDEERRLVDRIRRLVGERPAGDRTSDLVRLVVERRALRAQTLLGRTLRAGVSVHVIAVATALALLVLHVAYVVRAR